MPLWYKNWIKMQRDNIGWFDDEVDDREDKLSKQERSMKMLCWHVCGVKRVGFKRIFRRIIDDTQPWLVVIVETQISGRFAYNFLSSLKFGKFMKVDTMDAVGGIWILWKDDAISLSVNVKQFNQINCTIKILVD